MTLKLGNLYIAVTFVKIWRVGEQRVVNEKVQRWLCMKLIIVQILVVVAKIQVRILKIEVEKGFMRTAVDHELVDPKVKINLVNENLC